MYMIVRPICHTSQLLLKGLIPEIVLTMSRLGVSLCLINGVVEDKKFLRVVSEAITVSHVSYLTTFVKRCPPRNGSNYVKTVGVLMPHKWSCGGQEVPEGAF